MSTETLNLRQLNRATLFRQGLLARSKAPVQRMIERLVGLQAQMASAPFVGLWTRIEGFRREELAALIGKRRVVKATLMRATLHLCTARDYPWLRAAVQPALTSAADQIARQRKSGPIDRGELLEAARRFLAEGPRTYAELTEALEALKPGMDAGAMRYTVRTHLPIVQVPANSPWSYPGNPAWALADEWLGKAVDLDAHGDPAARLVRRYLEAFGPATAKDFETWSYLPDAKALFERLRGELVLCRDEKGRELFDLPGGREKAGSAGDLPAPVRFLPEFDDVLLSYDKRSRVVPDEFRKGVFLPGLRVAATFLVDGFVAGSWTIEVKGGSATLTLTPFSRLDRMARSDLVEEGERLIRFIEPDAGSHEVRVSS